MLGNTVVVQTLLDGDTFIVTTASGYQSCREDQQTVDWFHADDRPSDTHSLLRPAPPFPLYGGITLLRLCSLGNLVNDCESIIDRQCIEV